MREPGQIVGAYSLVERLAAGGMGEVWRARHELLGRPAAVKLITPNSSMNPHMLFERLGREARATSMLESPHTVSLYDFGPTDDGAFYAAMELLDGYDLRVLVDRYGPLPPERAIAILLQVCESLAEAHALGLVHRDIKPANILLCKLGLKVDVVKVLDFGLVKAASDPDLLPGPQLTASHAMVGSPAFIAPEALTHDAETGPAADQYGLGCVAFYLLTGQLVFDHAHPMDMMLAHRAEAPTPPSSRMGTPLPEGLDAVVLRCLEKSAQRRFESIEALAQALQQIQVEPPWTQARAQAWWAEHHERRWERMTPLPAGNASDTMHLSSPSLAPTPLAASPSLTVELPPPAPEPPPTADPPTRPSSETPPDTSTTERSLLPWVAAAAASMGLLVGGAGLAASLGAFDSGAEPTPDPEAASVEVVAPPDPEPAGRAEPEDPVEAEMTPDPREQTAPDPPSQPPTTVRAASATPADAPEEVEPAGLAPPPEVGRCSLIGEFTAVTLVDETGGRHRCGGELAAGSYAVHADFSGEGQGVEVASVQVGPEREVRIRCNDVDWSCAAQ